MRIETRAAEGVIAAVRSAAARTGTDFGFLLAQARSESGLDPRAQAKSSSARGLFQFTSGTWMEMVRRHGAEHGLGWAAEALKAGAAGSGVREAILALRDSPEAASLMAGELARDNAAALGRSLGRAVTAAEVHMASFLGASGATRFLTALAADPQAPAAAVVPQAAAANRAIFAARDGSPRSLAEVMAVMAGKIGGNDLPVRGNGLPVAAPPPAMLPAQARMAYLLLAELGG
ncbi:hypothetical protein GCM10007973_18640 [Polymorphobacter multimanifer]|uniref:Transglycosylase SLT domain-containing protein n=1 Tax=Polymorphobacter multimanifer TaxID=1070431 RepID=A0A841LC31_9SPHN|nr:transglycosylase SLT domain-containing protein [Polymorphobacter multimanifer]MBB6226702.1 hypothetical protein [Polymorphobacter multimanifer]GGI82504.1 hypothetical protein GCM10007973_18640 [Polymorphobacter multimanifer]